MKKNSFYQVSFSRNLSLILALLAMNRISAQSAALFDEAPKRSIYELSRLADPSTGQIPPNIRFKELAFYHTNHLPKTAANTIASEGTPWMHRGPFYVGGRTRAAAVDRANENRIVAGGVSSGMWLSEDAGITWNPTQEAWEISSISCLVQDKRTGHQQTWYAGTGEAYGQSAGSPGAYYYGNGLLVSNDSGRSWQAVASTTGTSNSSFNTPWQLVWNVLVDTTRYDSTILYAATYQQILRSNDGGNSWVVVRKTNAYFNEVYIDTDGNIYSTSSSDASVNQRGIFVSKNGWEWFSITPNDWQGRTYKRVVLGVRPSVESDTMIRLYAILNTENWGKAFPDSRGELEWDAMFVLDLSRTSPEKKIQERDLSANLPLSKYALNSWRTQGSYDMIVGVYPPKENTNDIVFIGGTNVYRSTTGFSDSLHTDIIAGYKRNTSLPNFEMWPNQHPDQHVWLFYDSDPKKVLNANDGGIFYAADCLAENVDWKPLNNGYLTTQFYTVALDHATNMSPLMVIGAQDNNQMITADFSPKAIWDIAYPGDGSYTAIEHGGKYAYFSKQLGNTVKAELDAQGNVLAKRRIDPIGVKRSDYQFINPFLLDPGNQQTMYMAAGRFIFRNDQLQNINLDGSTDSISMGWVRSKDSFRVVSHKITALGIRSGASDTEPRTLYFGNNIKYVYAIDNPATGDLAFRNLATPLASGNGNVSCIAVHPDNDKELVVAYSNYGIYSLYRSIDGGQSWEKIGGNLEVNEQGSGDAPSIRWFQYVPVANGMVYFVGTSIGLFATDSLAGVNTKWVHQAPGEIGNAVVDMIDYRPLDGTIAVATHGKGIYYARIFQKGAILSRENAQDVAGSVRLYPNPSSDQIRVEANTPLQSLKLYTTEGKELAFWSLNHELTVDELISLKQKGVKPGVYIFVVETNQGSHWERIIVE